jgi:hypothetical protein
MNRYEERAAREAFAELMAIPANNPDRPKLRERFGRYSPERLASLTRGWLTLSDEYAKRAAYDRERYSALPANVYPVWCRRTPQSKPQPFESGSNCLPGMEAFAEMVRQ